MSTRRHNIVNIAATVVLGTVLLCVGLFWVRWVCRVMQADALPPSARQATIHPSRHMNAGGTTDPNLLAPSFVTAAITHGDPLLAGLGSLHYLQTSVPGMPAGPGMFERFFQWSPEEGGEQLSFDPSLGLIVREWTERVPKNDGTYTRRQFAYYAGPEGISQTPDERLGRFISPMADAFRVEPQIVYDPAARRFFSVRWRGDARGVRKGPELPGEGRYRPVQLGILEKNSVAINVQHPVAPIRHSGASEPPLWAINYVDRILVLDASGRIDWLDPETLEIGGTAAYLTMPTVLFGSGRSLARPEEVSAYLVMPFLFVDGRARGTAVATLSREGLALRLSYFDANGVPVTSGEASTPRHEEMAGGQTRTIYVPSEKAAYSHVGLTLGKFLFESLHPPVLTLASYFAGPKLEATAGYRSVFLLPDSFVAKVARSGADVTASERFFWALGFLLPGLILFGLLAVKLDREGIRAGTPKNVRRAWIAGTITLGLPAYLAYRLTRPKVALVTCGNCGLGRRPDLDRCHRCGSVWAVPELIPPAWRVFGEPESADEPSPSRAEEAKPSAPSDV